ncbi:hypothetical protein ACLE1A_003498 [Cronobacter turicensis]
MKKKIIKDDDESEQASFFAMVSEGGLNDAAEMVGALRLPTLR